MSVSLLSGRGGSNINYLGQGESNINLGGSNKKVTIDSGPLLKDLCCLVNVER